MDMDYVQGNIMLLLMSIVNILVFFFLSKKENIYCNNFSTTDVRVQWDSSVFVSIYSQR